MTTKLPLHPTMLDSWLCHCVRCFLHLRRFARPTQASPGREVSPGSKGSCQTVKRGTWRYIYIYMNSKGTSKVDGLICIDFAKEYVNIKIHEGSWRGVNIREGGFVHQQSQSLLLCQKGLTQLLDIVGIPCYIFAPVNLAWRCMCVCVCVCVILRS